MDQNFSKNRIIFSLHTKIQNLQSKAIRQHQEGEKDDLKKTLKCLKDLRKDIDEILCKYWEHGLAHNENKQEACLVQLMELYGQDYEQPISEEYQEEDVCDNSLTNLLIKDLKQIEQSFEFHAKLVFQTRQLCVDRYSNGNFAYGSTPYTSWMSVLKSRKVYQKLLDIEQNEGQLYMVWGSSIGWLVFFTCLNFKVDCIGYEILQCHVEEAERIKQKYGIHQIKFVCDDMLSSDLTKVGILVLTSFCWDTELKIKAYKKIGSELMQGALVIDYSKGLTLRQKNFVVIDVINVPVSWNDNQDIYVMMQTSI